MILNTKTRYAVMAMVDLAVNASEKPVKLAEIAGRQDMSLAYLEQIFAKLRQHGLVKSIKGPGGGYMLTRTPKDLPISTIVTAAEEEMKMTRCEMESHTGCTATKEQCITHDLWEGLGDHIYQYFDSISLEDVCKRNLRKKQK